MTEQQRRTLGWLRNQWWITDRVYFRLADRWSRRALVRSRRDEKDWRIRLVGQQTWIRATRLQYDQAGQLGLERSIGVPQVEWTAVREPLQIAA